MIDAERLAALLSTGCYGHSLTALEQTGSTNDDARVAASDGAVDGHVIVAENQRRGRGARGRSWSSSSGTDLYWSLVARTALRGNALAPITLAAGVSVARAIEHVCDVRPAVKWPNDVYLGDRKCAGILVETTTTGTSTGPAIIGIGINVNRAVFEGDLANTATSLKLELGRDVDRESLLASVLLELEQRVHRLEHEGAAPLIAEVEEKLLYRNREVCVDEVRGELVGLSESGGLRLRTEDGEHTVMAGTLRLA